MDEKYCFFCHNTATQWLFKVTSGTYDSVHVEAAARESPT